MGFHWHAWDFAEFTSLGGCARPAIEKTGIERRPWVCVVHCHIIYGSAPVDVSSPSAAIEGPVEVLLHPLALPRCLVTRSVAIPQCIGLNVFRLPVKAMKYFVGFRGLSRDFMGLHGICFMGFRHTTIYQTLEFPVHRSKRFNSSELSWAFMEKIMGFH